MRVLITGSEGVLGSVLKEELRRRGDEVFGCDIAHAEDKMVMRADIRERRQLSRVFDFAKPEFVFHFAAEFGRLNGQTYYEQLWSVNCIGTRNVIEECLRCKSILAFASSSEAYGLSEDYANGQPLREGMLDTHIPRFHNEYSLSKWTNERQIHTAVRNNGLDAMILRFFNVYGPPEKFSPYRSVVCQFIYKMLAGDPVTVNREGCRSHLWIGDWCNTVAGMVEPERLDLLMNTANWEGAAGTPYTPVFNIGGDDYEPILSLYTRLRKMIPRVGDVQDVFIDKEEANTATKRPDNSTAREYLDHFPKMALEEGLALTIKWMKGEYSL